MDTPDMNTAQPWTISGLHIEAPGETAITLVIQEEEKHA